MTDNVKIIKDEKGVRVYDEFFGIGFNAYVGGKFTDKNGKEIAYKEGQKITIGDKVLRLSAGQALILRDMLNDEKIQAELRGRLLVEREAAATAFARL